MPSLSSLNMIGLDAFVCPLTFRYNIGTPWGNTSHEITFEIPSFKDRPELIGPFAGRMWRGFIAKAISRQCSADFVEVVRWKTSPLPLVLPTGAPPGGNGNPSGARSASGCLVFHTAGIDQYSRRRFPLPGLPAIWSQAGLLTDAGMASLYDMVAILNMGLLAPELPRYIDWLLPYPRVVDADPSNILGVAFRRVEYVRICEYTYTPADQVPLDWP